MNAGRVIVRLWRFGAPVGASLAVHGALLAFIITAALTVRTGFRPGARVEHLEISLAAPAPPAPTSTAESAEAPAPPAPAAPELEGLASPNAPAAPALRSLASPTDAGLSALRRTAPAEGGATFAGLKSDRAGSIVYVVDASGAMLTSLADVIPELERSISRLAPTQRFTIILFRDRPARPGEGGGRIHFDIFTPTPYSPPALVPATAEAKRAAVAWARAAEPRGISNPSDGLRRALEFKPSVVFLLARSIKRSGGADDQGQWGAGRDAILEELERLNPADPRTGRRPVVIKAVQFLEEDPSGIMQAVGEAHGGGAGGYTVLTRQMLGAR